MGGDELTAWEYLLRATLSFSTVLPAVLGTAEWLTTSPRCSAGLDRFVTMECKHRRTWGWVLVCSVVGLLGIGLWPDLPLFLVWVAPLLLITALQLIRDEPTIFRETTQGDWRALWAVALAALICGLFWEMWNYLQPGPLGICGAVRAAIRIISDAVARLCRLPAVRVGMSCSR